MNAFDKFEHLCLMQCFEMFRINTVNLEAHKQWLISLREEYSDSGLELRFLWPDKLGYEEPI